MRRVDRNKLKKNRRRKIIRRRLLLIFLVGLLFISGVKFKDEIASFGKGALDLLIGQGEGKTDPDLSPDPSQDPGGEEDKDEDDIIEKKENTEVSILAAGDIMFHMPQIDAARKSDGQFDFAPSFQYIKKYNDQVDLSIANLETVTAGNDRGFFGFPQFNSPHESIFGIKEAGFDILSTANNHSLDQKKEGIINTLNYIEDYGLKSVGTYKERDTEPLIEEINEISFGFLAYTYGLNGLDGYLTEDELSYMINLIDEEKIRKDIEDLKEREVDIIVVSMHWGNEYHRQPSDYQMELGHKLVDWGANIVLGSHPHVIQKAERVKKDNRDNFIIYSMGNFLSNQSYESMGNSYTEDGLMIKIQVEKNHEEEETLIKDVEFLPTWVYKYWENGKNHYSILPAKEILDGELDLNLSEKTLNRIRKSYQDTMDTLNQK